MTTKTLRMVLAGLAAVALVWVGAAFGPAQAQPRPGPGRAAKRSSPSSHSIAQSPLQVVGTRASLIPEPFGPRNRSQSSADAA